MRAASIRRAPKPERGPVALERLCTLAPRGLASPPVQFLQATGVGP